MRRRRQGGGDDKGREALRQRAASLEHASLPEALAKLSSNPERGLSEPQAQQRLAQLGPNLIEEKKRGPLARLLSYFWGPIPWMLEIACVLSAIAKRDEELIVVFAMLLINGGVGYWHESRAAKAIEALKATLSPRARVLRDGKRRTVNLQEVVPGDIIVLRRGDVVPADARVLAAGLSIDESSLTGESLPVDKNRGQSVFASTVVKRGEARALVIATGATTRFGRTVELVASVHERSHFEKAVLRIGYFLMAATAVLVLLVVIVALVRHGRLIDVFVFALILTVAGIPVALPAVLSVTMAVGARRLAAQKAIVSRLAAMEEVAGVKTLFADKTGTLTRNELALQKTVLIDAQSTEQLVLAAALTAERGSERDAVDTAVLSAVDASELAPYRIQSFQPFDSTSKRASALVVRDNESFEVAKGAPQVITQLCAPGTTGLTQTVQREVDALAKAGLRALGVAQKDAGHGWRYLGLLALSDPPRQDSARVVEEAHAHGVDVRMLTGDHRAIAQRVAEQVGLGSNIVTAGDWLRTQNKLPPEESLTADGFAEVTPEDKYNLVGLFQKMGRIVAMTGDGVNDAPALRKADVGFAVASATEAARAAADIVLTEPGLGVIINAIEEARRIFERMLSYATFRIAETSRMVVFIAGAIVLLGFYPVTAIMVALLAVLNDIPIMAIATDNTQTAKQPVRWHMRWVLADASLLGLTGIAASFLLLWLARTYLQPDVQQLQTIIFLKLLVAGHMTIYVTRVRDWFWRRPWPSWRLFLALESTQVVGTMAAIFGWLVTAIPWWVAAGIWGYAIFWMLVLSGVRVAAFRKLRPKLQPVTAAETSFDAARRPAVRHDGTVTANGGDDPAEASNMPGDALPTRDPTWLLVEEGFTLTREHEVESLFSIANGYVGTRGSLVEGSAFSAPATFIAGFFDVAPGTTPALVSINDWTALHPVIDGAPLRLDAGEVLEHRRTLDLRQGILWRHWQHRDPHGRITTVEGMRLASLANRRLLLQSVMLTPENYSGTVVVPSPVSFDFVRHTSAGATAVVCMRSWLVGPRAASREIDVDGKGEPLSVDVELGETYRLDRIVAVATSRDTPQPEHTAAHVLDDVVARGVDALVSDHRRAWLERWAACDVRIDGDDAAQRAVRFAAYHLTSAADPDDDRVSVGARALTGPGYRGHVFWDTEIYMLPFYALSWPEAARALLRYRYHTLEAARVRAQQLGYRGALYAWESTTDGRDVTPPFVTAPGGEVLPVHVGKREQHISADVAYAVWSYWHITHDWQLLLDGGAEIVLETARFWASRLSEEQDGKLHICGVIGPDEYHELVDDDAYTNGMAQWNLGLAATLAFMLAERWPKEWHELSRRLQLDSREVESWRRLAEKVYLPLDSKTGLIEQFRGYFDLDEALLPAHDGQAPEVVIAREHVRQSKIVKQPDVLMLLYLLWERFAPEVRVANFRYYEPRTHHGSSLSPSIHALLAARLKDVRLAEHYFRQSAEIDLADNMGNAALGVHAAALGGLWQAVVFGFAGLDLSGETPRVEPQLPPSWRRLAFHIHWRGQKLAFDLSHDTLGQNEAYT